jgi:type III restriction enzyme
MTSLHGVLRDKTLAWKAASWASDDFPTIAEILEWAGNPDGCGFVLRQPQFQALQVYWYLRLVEKTPLIREIYERVLPSKGALAPIQARVKRA